MTKKLISLLLLAAFVLTPAAVGSAYAFFVYTDGSASVPADPSASNVYFDGNEANDYYRVYFFASPYYATGADGIDSDDPLVIANSENNPYNSDEQYCLCGTKLENGNTKYANAKFSSGDYHYISYKSKNVDVLTDDYSNLELFTKKEYTGYIRANEDLGFTRTSKYVALTVRGNISLEQLSGIVASTEFRDSYGFGPEFMGWTWNKGKIKERTMHGDDRYAVNRAQMKRCDSRGYGIDSDPGYQIGNFGAQGDIEQITANTSLLTIDKGTADGSAANDHIIYLYPVFISKNYASSVGDGVNGTSIIKFRVNPDTDKDADGIYKYVYRQSSEVDYSLSRFTAGFFQHKLNDAKNNVNYYTDDFYISDSLYLQLDICPSGGNGNWSSNWYSILTVEQIRSLGLEKGYYNVDMTYVMTNSSNEASAVNALKEQYKSTNNYIQIYTSLDANSSSGVVSYDGYKAYFVIGFQKVEEYRLVSGTNTYDTPGYKTLHSTSAISGADYILYRVHLKKNDIIDILTGDSLGASLTLKPFETDPTGFVSVGDDKAISINTDGTLTVDRAGSYTLVFKVDYSDGKPSVMHVAYRQNEYKYYFIVLKDKPAFREYYTDRAALYDSNTLIQKDGYIGTYLSMTDVSQLFSDNPGRKLIDTATGKEVPKAVFESGAFCLDRNYVLYFE